MRSLLLAAIVLSCGSCTEATYKVGATDLPDRSCERPCQCRHLQHEPDPDTWDEEKHEYPRNHAWENCMGVGER